MEIVSGKLLNPRVIQFLKEHLDHMHGVTPPGSVHALDIEALRSPDILFFSGWEDGEVICCGALKRLDATNGELKSMRTAPHHVRKGVASQLLTHILSVAKQTGFTQIYLETGSYEAFHAARRLYETFGFVYCEPFSHYTDRVNSVYMRLTL